MCGRLDAYGVLTTIPAHAYLSDAKRLNKNLKTMRSVSRDYRRMRVREVKEAAAAHLMREREKQQKEKDEMDARIWLFYNSGIGYCENTSTKRIYGDWLGG